MSFSKEEDVLIRKEDLAETDNRIITDIDSALDTIGLGWFHVYLFVTCGCGFMTDAMEVTLLAFLYSCLTYDWDLSTSTADLVTSCVFLGELCGSLFFGNLADHLGRRPTGLAGNFFVLAGGLLSATANSVVPFIIYRTFVGFGIGSFIVPFDMISEMIPRKWRGTFMMLYEFWWAFGSCYTICMAWLILTADTWRLLIVVNSIPAVISIVMMYFLPESPRWLLSKGQVTDAEEVLQMIARWNGQPMPKVKLEPIADTTEHGDFLSVLKLPYILMPGMPIVWACFGFTFYGMSYTVADLFETGDDDTCSFDYVYLFLIYSTEFVGALLPLCTIDTLGRAMSQVIWYQVSGVSALVVGFSDSSATQLVASAIFMAANMAASSLTWVHTPELYPTKIRSTAHCVANSFTRCAAASASYWAYSGYSLEVITGLYALVSFLAASITHFLPETKNQKLD